MSKNEKVALSDPLCENGYIYIYTIEFIFFHLLSGFQNVLSHCYILKIVHSTRDFVVWDTTNSKKGKSVKKTIISPFLKVNG